MTERRGTSAYGQLARLGFTDPTRAAANFATPALQLLGAGEQIRTALGRTADPDAALDALGRLLNAAADDEVTGSTTSRAQLVAALQDDERLRDRLLSVLGASRALADHLVRHPQQWRSLTDPARVRPTAAALRAELLT
ncbi:MAG: bifunctional glutamine-synthetase adenylyltransferase/deadenyltransferase, partial [Sporichthyaceae bacterium]|nr:bifunctional glutamine-synthetase adenylyltransferase/deadenyltransferase [Sporichthyaceae bacterium]